MWWCTDEPAFLANPTPLPAPEGQPMTSYLSDDQLALKDALAGITEKYDQAYWTEVDSARRYPDEFVKALTDAGWLAILIPEEYGGGGGSITDAAVMMETLERAGCAV